MHLIDWAILASVAFLLMTGHRLAEIGRRLGELMGNLRGGGGGGMSPPALLVAPNRYKRKPPRRILPPDDKG